MAIRNNKLGGNDWQFQETNLASSDLNDTFNAVIDKANTIGVGVAQNAYQTLQANNIFQNKDFLAADEFVTASGTNGTINTGNSTAEISSTDGCVIRPAYEALSDTTITNLSSVANIFDGDNSTLESFGVGTSLVYVGKTFASKYVKYVKYKFTIYGSSIYTATIKLEYYDGSNWVVEKVIKNSPRNNGESFEDLYYFNKTVQGIRLTFVASNLSYTLWLYTLDYGGSHNNSSVLICDTNTLTLNGTEDVLSVYADKEVPTNTNITVDISDGTNSITGQPVNSTIDISSLGSGTLQLTFNLTTTDTTVTPKIYGWSVYKQ